MLSSYVYSKPRVKPQNKTHFLHHICRNNYSAQCQEPRRHLWHEVQLLSAYYLQISLLWHWPRPWQLIPNVIPYLNLLKHFIAHVSIFSLPYQTHVKFKTLALEFLVSRGAIPSYRQIPIKRYTLLNRSAALFRSPDHCTSDVIEITMTRPSSVERSFEWLNSKLQLLLTTLFVCYWTLRYDFI